MSDDTPRAPHLHHRARLAAATMRGNVAEAAAARADLAEAVLEMRIRRAVEAAPPLSVEQVERLRALLDTSRVDGAA